MARETRHIIPEDYVLLPPQSDGSPNERADDHLEDAHDAAFMKRTAVMDVEAAPQLAFNHNLFRTVMRMRDREKEWREQCEEQEKAATEGVNCPVCVKIIGSNESYRQAYSQIVKGLSCQGMRSYPSYHPPP